MSQFGLGMPRPPSTSWPVRIMGIVVALIIGAFILKLVFTFAYYASGMAVNEADERLRREAPIPVSFGDPNAVPLATAAPPSN